MKNHFKDLTKPKKLAKIRLISPEKSHYAQKVVLNVTKTFKIHENKG